LHQSLARVYTNFIARCMVSNKHDRHKALVYAPIIMLRLCCG